MSDENITVFTLDPDNLPPLTAKQIAMLEALDRLPDEEIDLSDAPEHDFERYPMTRAVPGARPRPEPEREPAEA